MNNIQLTEAVGAYFPVGLRRLDYESALDGQKDWALLRPGQDRGPWIVVIHGHGSQGDQLFTRADVRQAWLPVFLESGAGLLTVNLRGNAWMGPAAAADMHAMLEWMRAEYGLKQTIFCSGSMGGTSNLIYGALYPGDVSGIIARGAAADLATYHAWCLTQDQPILREIAQAIQTSYGGAPADVPEIYRRHSALHNAATLTMPVYCSHGGADAIIPVAQARALAKRLHGAPHFVYKEILGGNHDAPLHETEDFEMVLRLIKHDYSG